MERRQSIKDTEEHLKAILESDNLHIKTLKNLIYTLKKKYKIQELVDYTEKYLELQTTKPNNRLAIEILHHLSIGRFGYCIDKVMQLAKDFENADESQRIELINYRLFKIIIKLPIMFADKYWMKYTPTKNLINAYFPLLVDKLRTKAETNEKIYDKLA